MAKIKIENEIIKFKQINIYPGFKRIDKAVATKNLLDIKRIFDSNDLFFGLAYGTLLGAIRENDFITHDEDIDLYILKEDENKFRSLLSVLIDNGFELIRYERSGLYSIRRDGEYTDFYCMTPYSKGIRWNGAENFILETFILNTKKIVFKGSEFNIPQNIDLCLEILYGKNWRIPIEYFNYNLSYTKICAYKLYFIIRRNLPDILYEYYQKFYYLKRYNKLIKKCSAYSIEL